MLGPEPILCLVSDLGFGGVERLEKAVAMALANGATMIQYRDKPGPTALNDRQAYALSLRLKALAHAHGAHFIVNDRVDLAMAVGADGVHVGQGDLPASLVRHIWPGAPMIGVSAACLADVEAALAEGADYIGYGAVFPTATKQDAVISNLEGLRQAVLLSQRPVLAIGGIGMATIGSVAGTGCAGAAVVSAILGAEDPAMATRRLAEAWRKGSL